MQFLVVRDGSGMCQAVMENTDGNADLFSKVKHLGQESSLKVEGTVRAEERSVGGYELAVTAALRDPAVDYQLTHTLFTTIVGWRNRGVEQES